MKTKSLNFFNKLTFQPRAFTLAETLIVIGIIGVVAALTLPNLNHATGNKETITRVKKVYAALTEAFDRAQAIYGDIDTWFVQCDNQDYYCPEKITGRRVTEFMKISKDCGMEANQGCFTSGFYKNLNLTGNTDIDAYGGIYKAVTADGMSIGIIGSSVIDVYVDVDGPNKGPFSMGKDLFKFSIIPSDKILKDDCSSSYYNTFSSVLSSLYPYGNCASRWILEYDNMDYLHFVDKSGTCDNGNTVTESHPSCN